MRVRVLGMVWYRQEDFDRLKAMFSDGSKIGPTFDDWLDSAQKGYEKLTADGNVVVKAYIDPESFPQWCAEHGKELDARGRSAYANERAAKSVRATL